MLKLEKLEEWLKPLADPPVGKYVHRQYSEQSASRDGFVERLKPVVQRAHRDAQLRLRKMAGTPLDPLGSQADAANGYPGKLNGDTLMGCFGEILAGILAENSSPHGVRWEVPAFLFRFHNVAFHELDRLRQEGGMPRKVPGRTGDDCLAFYREGNSIKKSLVCEAKCLKSHVKAEMEKAHEKLSESRLKPGSLLELIEVLIDYDDEESARWVEALRALNLDEGLHDYERCDFLSYTCGKSPKLGGRKTWIPQDSPHPMYTANRRLEVAEVCIADLRGLVMTVYGKKEG